MPKRSSTTSFGPGWKTMRRSNTYWLKQAGSNIKLCIALMARKPRKTLVVCHPCHDAIHANPVTTAA